MKKKNLLFVLLGVFLGLLFALPFTHVAENHRAINTVVLRENDETAEDEDMSLDENNNNIPDAIENYWDENVAVYIGGISLATCVGLVISIVTIFYNVSKTKKATAETKEAIKASTELVENTVGEDKRLITEQKELIERYEDLQKVTSEKLTETTAELEKVKESLEVEKLSNESLKNDYNTINERLSVVLKNQDLMSNSATYVLNGVASKVKKNVKEITEDGTETETEGN